MNKAEQKRYLDLYVTESREHLGHLNRALLALEQGEKNAVEAAFRAAHTIKGMSATMGFAGVSEFAHELETLLDTLRTQARAIDATMIDELLAGADALERGIDAAARGEPPAVRSPAGVQTVATVAALVVAARPGTRYARVAIAASEPMKVARALIITRDLTRKGLALRSQPEEFGEDFNGHFAVILAPNSDEAEVAAYLAASPEVASFSLEQVADVGAGAAAAEKEAATSYLRVDQRHMDEVAETLGEIGVLQGSIAKLMQGERGGLPDMVARMSRLLNDLQHTVLAMRMVPVGDAFDRFPRMVRDSARSLGKQLEFRVEGRDIEIDRAILEQMADPLVHLLRNALDHGIETPAEREAAGKPGKARLALRAWRDRASVTIQLEDDGRGVDVSKVVAKARAMGLETAEAAALTADELLRIIAHPGFSTAAAVTDVSGRGVGLDVVVNRIRALGGAIDMQTRAGAGTTFTLKLPITLAIAQALRVRIGEEDYAIPLTHVAEAVELATTKITRRKGREVVHLRGEVLPLIRLRSVLKTPTPGRETAAIVAELGERRTALAVDHVVGREQILIKPFDSAVGMLPIFSGVTLLPDGRAALVLDPMSVV